MKFLRTLSVIALLSNLLPFTLHLYAEEADYIRLLNSRNNRPRMDLSAGWNTEEGSEIFDLPCLFSDSVFQVTLIKEFTIPEIYQNYPLRIWFMGIAGNSAIYINGNLIRLHENFRSGFYIPVPGEFLFNGGPNRLKVVLYRQNTNIQELPQFVELFRENQVFGILREVYIEWQPECTFNDFDYNFSGNSLFYSYSLEFLETFPAAQKKVRLDERVSDPTGRVIFTRFEYIVPETREFERTITGNNFQLWSPDTPNLYRIELKVTTAEGNTFLSAFNAGLRKLSTSSSSIMLNGKTIHIHGINYRENYTNNLSDIRKNYLNHLTIIRHSNFNAVRIPHSVPHPIFAELCDSLGILLFVENWIWRLPNHFFSDDRLLRITKTIGDESLGSLHLHPSLTGYGIGHEIDLNDPTVNKFMLIINEYLKYKFRFLSYTSPLNSRDLPRTPVGDFYALFAYDKAVFRLFEESPLVSPIPLIIANTGFAAVDSLARNRSMQQWQSFLSRFENQNFINGFFAESFNDWPGLMPAPRTYGTHNANNFIYQYGLFDQNGTNRNIIELRTVRDVIPTLQTGQIDQTNFFTLCVFIASILFFLIYRKNLRLRENLKRALSHPYGFFVDLRDRRIISIANSTLIALYTTLIVANVLAAYVYYYRDHLLFDEYVSTILSTSNLKSEYYEMSTSPVKSFLFFWIFSYVLQIITAFLMKIFNLFSKYHFRFRQSLAISNWSGAPILFLMPVSLLAFQILKIDSLRPLLIFVIFLFIFWYHLRLIRGIRILFMKQFIPVLLIVILTYGGLVIIFNAFSDINMNTVRYWLLISQSSGLF